MDSAKLADLIIEFSVICQGSQALKCGYGLGVAKAFLEMSEMQQRICFIRIQLNGLVIGADSIQKISVFLQCVAILDPYVVTVLFCLKKAAITRRRLTPLPLVSSSICLAKQSC